MTFTLWTAAWLAARGLGVGAFGTVVGAGAGFILTPILLLLYPHGSPRTITGISLAVVFFNAASGLLAYTRQRRIDHRSGVLFALATLPGAVAALSSSASGRPGTFRAAASRRAASRTRPGRPTATRSRCGAASPTAPSSDSSPASSASAAA